MNSWNFELLLQKCVNLRSLTFNFLGKKVNFDYLSDKLSYLDCHENCYKKLPAFINKIGPQLSTLKLQVKNLSVVDCLSQLCPNLTELDLIFGGPMNLEIITGFNSLERLSLSVNSPLFPDLDYKFFTIERITTLLAQFKSLKYLKLLQLDCELKQLLKQLVELQYSSLEELDGELIEDGGYDFPHFLSLETMEAITIWRESLPNLKKIKDTKLEWFDNEENFEVGPLWDEDEYDYDEDDEDENDFDLEEDWDLSALDYDYDGELGYNYNHEDFHDYDYLYDYLYDHDNWY